MASLPIHSLLHIAYSHNFAACINPYCDLNSWDSVASAEGGCFVTLDQWFFILVANHLGTILKYCWHAPSLEILIELV